MFFWIFFIIISLICFGPFNVGGIRYKKLSYIVGCSFITIVTILRFDVGFDYPEYFNMVYPYLDIIQYNRMEPANKILLELTANSQYPPLLFIVYGIITFILFFYSFKNYSNNYCLAILTYLTFFYLGGLSTIRQEIAVSLILWGYRFIRDDNRIMYLVMCILALLFHDTAFVAILTYPFLRIKNIKISIIVAISAIILLGGVVELLLTLPSLSHLYHYLEDANTFQGGNLIRIIYLLISLFSLISAIRNNNIVLVNMSLLCLIGTSMMFVLGGHIGGRIAEYFTIYLCLLIPNIVTNYYKKYILNVALILSILFISNVYISTTNPIKSPFTPYQSILTLDLNKLQFK